MKIEAYAKANFTLEVFGERADGFHALRSLVVPLSLHDTIEFDFADSFSCDTGYENDLCLKAAGALSARYRSDRGYAPRPVAVHVVKRIPAGGGLGGGSADAAATLVALNEMWSTGLDMPQLAHIGASVGSDVPALVFAQSGVPVVMEGRGEKVNPRLGLKRVFDLVVANPGVHSSTAEVYSRCISRVTDEPSIMYNIVRAVERGGVEDVAAALCNDLSGPAESLHPEIAAAKAALSGAGAMGATVCGSGASVFGLAAGEAEAKEIVAAVRVKGFAAWTAKTCCPVV